MYFPSTIHTELLICSLILLCHGVGVKKTDAANLRTSFGCLTIQVVQAVFYMFMTIHLLTSSSQENFYSPSSSYNSLTTASLQHLFLGICQTLSIPAIFCPFPRSHIALGHDLCSDLLDKIIFYHNV